MYSTKSYLLTEAEYNYLLPALKAKLSYMNNKHYFIGSFEELSDMLNRLKGLYDFYKDLNSMIAYHCSKFGNLEPFRIEVA